MHTTNGGATWVIQQNMTYSGLVGVSVTDANHCWTVGNCGTILHTTNGGSTWLHQNNGTMNWLDGVEFIDSNHGWVVGDSGTILHTTNSGSTWINQPSGTLHWLNRVKFVGDSLGWSVGDSGTILHTTNSGTIGPDKSAVGRTRCTVFRLLIAITAGQSACKARFYIPLTADSIGQTRIVEPPMDYWK